MSEKPTQPKDMDETSSWWSRTKQRVTSTRVWQDFCSLSSTGIVDLNWLTRLIILGFGILLAWNFSEPIADLYWGDVVSESNSGNNTNADSEGNTQNLFILLRKTFFFTLIFSFFLWLIRTADKKKEFNDNLQQRERSNISEAIKLITSKDKHKRVLSIPLFHRYQMTNLMTKEDYLIYMNIGFPRIGNESVTDEEVSQVFNFTKDTDLSGALFDSLDFRGVNFNNSTARRAIIRDTIFGHYGKMGHENKEDLYVDLSESEEDSRIRALKYANENAFIALNYAFGGDFEGTMNFENVTLSQCVLQSINFKGATLTNITLENALFFNCDFRNSTIINMETKEIFQGDTFVKLMNFRKEYRDRKTLDFRGANLKESNIQNWDENVYKHCDVLYDLHTTQFPKGFKVPENWIPGDGGEKLIKEPQPKIS